MFASPIRVVCNNTLTLSLGGLPNSVKVSLLFNAEQVKETMGIVLS